MHLGSSTVLPCSFPLPDSNELPNITWSFNGSVIASNNQTESEGSLSTSTSGFNGTNFPLMVYNVTLQNQGVYECHMDSNLIRYFRNITLIILGELNEMRRYFILKWLFENLFLFFFYTKKYIYPSQAVSFSQGDCFP